MWPALSLGALLAAIALVYLPGLPGPFLFDDLTSIVGNPFLTMTEIGWEPLLVAATSGESGPLGRPLAYVTFALDHWAHEGFSPAGFKATNVAIHMVNTVLVYRLASLLLAGERLATIDRGAHWRVPALAAALWGLHPLQLTSVLYTVQRMTSLSALGVLAGLIVFLEARRRLATTGCARPLVVMGLGLAGGGLLALSAKENGVLIVLLAAVIEVWLLDSDRLARRGRARLIAFYAGFVAAPLGAALLALALEPGLVLAGYRERAYGPWERLLTEARALFYYLGLLVAPRTSELSLVHDDFAASAGLWRPWTTALAVAGWGALGVVAMRARRSRPIIGFAIAWYVAGHLLESTVVPLDLVHEHRNYLPILGPLLAVAWYTARARPTWIRGLGPVLLVVLAGVTAVRASVWGSEDALTAKMVRHHPESARAHGLRAQFLIDARGAEDAVYAALAAVVRLDRTNVSALSEMLRMVSARLPAGRAVRAGTAADPGVYAPGLPADPVELQAREEALVAEMERRLREEPAGANTVQTLYELGACVERREARCTALEEKAREWSLAVLTHRSLSGRFQGVLWAQLARSVAAREPARAIVFLERAAAADAVNRGYLLDLVRLHAAHGEWAQAAAALERACSGAGVAVQRALARLEKAFDRAGHPEVGCG